MIDPTQEAMTSFRASNETKPTTVTSESRLMETAMTVLNREVSVVTFPQGLSNLMKRLPYDQ